MAVADGAGRGSAMDSMLFCVGSSAGPTSDAFSAPAPARVMASPAPARTAIDATAATIIHGPRRDESAAGDPTTTEPGSLRPSEDPSRGVSFCSTVAARPNVGDEAL